MIILLFAISIILVINFIYNYYNIKLLMILYKYQISYKYKLIKDFDHLLLYIDCVDKLKFVKDTESSIMLSMIYNEKSDCHLFKRNKKYIKYIIYTSLNRYIVHPRLNLYLDNIFVDLKSNSIKF